MSEGNGRLTPEVAEKILNMLTQVDEGNSVIMTDSFTKFVSLFPEYRGLAGKVYERVNYRAFRPYEEGKSARGY